MVTEVYVLRYQTQKGRMKWHKEALPEDKAKKLRDAIRREGRRATLKKFTFSY